MTRFARGAPAVGLVRRAEPVVGASGAADTGRSTRIRASKHWVVEDGFEAAERLFSIDHPVV